MSRAVADEGGGDHDRPHLHFTAVAETVDPVDPLNGSFRTAASRNAFWQNLGGIPWICLKALCWARVEAWTAEHLSSIRVTQ